MTALIVGHRGAAKSYKLKQKTGHMTALIVGHRGARIAFSGIPVYASSPAG